MQDVGNYVTDVGNCFTDFGNYFTDVGNDFTEFGGLCFSCGLCFFPDLPPAFPPLLESEFSLEIIGFQRSMGAACARPSRSRLGGGPRRPPSQNFNFLIEIHSVRQPARKLRGGNFGKLG